MGTEIVSTNRQPPGRPTGAGPLPAIILNAGANARYAYAEFFGDEVENEHTRKVYRHAVDRFLAWCETQSHELHRIPPGSVGQYIRSLTTTRRKPASKPTQKLHLAAIRKFFDTLVVRHAVVINPAASVHGPKLKMTVGKTPAADPEQARRVLQVIDASNVVGLRDRAIIATLIYTACRVGAVAKLQRKHFYTDGRQWYLHLDEKGGNDRQIPCRHDLQAYIEEYLAAAGAIPDADAPLFRTAVRRTRRLALRQPGRRRRQTQLGAGPGRRGRPQEIPDGQAGQDP